MPSIALKNTAKSTLYAALFIQALGAAGTYIIAKGAMLQMAPLVFGFYRFNLAALIFVGIMIFRRTYFPFDKSEWRLLIILAILAIPINQGFFLLGLSLTPATHPALLYATAPIWIYLISSLRKEEKYSHWKTIGIAIAITGVSAFFIEKGITMELNYLLGDFLILIAVWAWAAYTVLGLPLIKKYDPLTVTAAALLIGTVIYFPIGLVATIKFDYSHVTWVSWSGVIYTAVLMSVVLYTLWYWIIQRLEPSRAAVFANLQPIFTGVMAYFILGERLSGGSVIFGLIVLLGVIIAQRK